jgi:hypothetical protein
MRSIGLFTLNEQIETLVRISLASNDGQSSPTGGDLRKSFFREPIRFVSKRFTFARKGAFVDIRGTVISFNFAMRSRSRSIQNDLLRYWLRVR